MENEEVKQIKEQEEAKINYQKLTEDQKEAIVQEQVESLTEQDMVSFNSYKIQKDFPNTYAALTTFISEKTKMEAENDTVTAVLCYTSTSALFAFFDKNKVFLDVTGETDNFCYYIPGSEKQYAFATRSKALIAGFLKAFEILEEIIK